jgi:hypothetical protein
MSETPDPLEAELSALRPHDVSPGLRQGVAQSLAHIAPAKLRPLWWLAFAGGLAVACLAVVLFWRRGGDRIETKPFVRSQPKPPALVEDSGPTLLAYERALARSPQELDALLDKDAGIASAANSELVRVGAFTRFDAALHALLGED